MTDVSWMLELWLPSTLKGRSSPPTAQTESFTFLPMDALSWGSKLRGNPSPHSSSCLVNPPTSLPTALLSGFPILVTSCPHLPAAVALPPQAQFGVKPLLISQSGLLFL